MTAVIIVPVGVPVLWAVGSIAAMLAAWVFLSHLASPKVKRCAVVSLVAVSLVVVAPRPVHADDGEIVVIEDPCKKYTSDDWQWWAAGCWLP